jgi:hypothetical protein
VNKDLRCAQIDLAADPPSNSGAFGNCLTVPLPGKQRHWRNRPTLTTTRHGSGWRVESGSNDAGFR